MHRLNFVARVPFVAFAVAIGITAIANASPLVSDPNLLQGLASNPATGASSTVTNSDYQLSNATDLAGGDGGAGNDFVFAQTDPDQRLALTGFAGPIGTVRVWTASDLAPQNIQLYTSTTVTTPSINLADYGSPVFSVTHPAYLLGPLGSGPGEGLEYFDITMNLPVGTQTILLEFLNVQGQANGDNGFRRIAEVQAFAPVPEPSSFVLLGLGAVGLYTVARRRRTK